MVDPVDSADDDVLAAELVLGLLPARERTEALRRAAADPGFAAAIEGWNRRLAPLLDTLPEVPAPGDAWPAIAQRVAPVSSASVTRWRVATGVATAIAAALAVVIVTRPPAQAPAPVVVVQQVEPLLAQVSGAAGTPILSAQFDATTGTMRTRTDGLPPNGRVPELWVIREGAPPLSLGFARLNGVHHSVMNASLRQMLHDGATIAVTLEPQSDTPHAAPTGAVLGTARLTAV
jgi:anti-sigma-K factor RskA